MNVLLLLLLTPGQVNDSFRPPIVGMPLDFNDAVGVFSLETKLDKKTVEIGNPVILTVRIHAKDKALVPPSRPKIRENPLFKQAFFIEDPVPAGRKIDAATWEFYYRLKPRDRNVRKVPGIKLVYFDPAFGEDPMGYQPIYSEPLSLTVTQKKSVAVPVVGGDRWLNKPSSFFEMSEGDLLRRQEEVWHLPSFWWMLGFFFVPPVACFIWLLIWQRLYPNAAQLSRRRRSRAAKQALKALPVSSQDQIFRILMRFFQERLDLVMSAPTAAEMTAHLHNCHLKQRNIEQGAKLLQLCEAMRYAPQTSSMSTIKEDVRDWLVSVEDELWSR